MSKQVRISFDEFDFAGQRRIEKPKPADKELKQSKYFFVWVEGIEPKGGEKIKHFRRDGSIEYTLEMMEAMRVKKSDIFRVKEQMRSHGVANWVLEGNTFIRTSYAPKGTVFGSKSYYEQIKK